MKRRRRKEESIGGKIEISKLVFICIDFACDLAVVMSYVELLNFMTSFICIFF